MRKTLLPITFSAILGLLAGVYLAYVSALGEAGRITTSERLQIGLSVANLIIVAMLAGITLWYAKSTKQIADATGNQAEATRAQAEVVGRQMIQGVRPIIRFVSDSLPKLDASNLVIRNIGVGPALNTKCWVETQQPGGSRASHNNDGQQREFSTSVLEMNGVMGDGAEIKWQLNLVPKPTENRPCTFFAVYQDVYGNYFVSRAAYEPIDVKETRPLKLVEFSTDEVSKDEAMDYLRRGGYS